MDSLADNEEIYFENGEYLKRERERERASSDRQTLLTDTSIKSYVDLVSTRNLTGGGTTTSIEDSEESEITLPIRMEQTHRTGKYGKQYNPQVEQAFDGVGRSEDSHFSQGSSLLNTLLTQDYSKTIDNLRVQRLMGINRTDGKATMENIPSKADRSAFSCERYQFFLDAPFEVGNQCCNVMKKNPMKKYAKETGRRPITAQMASESRLRAQKWLNSGCNGFDLKSPISNPS